MSIQAKVAKVTKVHQFVNDSGTMNGNIYVTLMILMPLFWCFFFHPATCQALDTGLT